MNQALRSGVIVLAILFTAATANAGIIFTAHLTHDNPESPDDGSTGDATFQLNDLQNRLMYDIKLFGMDIDGNQTPGNPSDNVTRAHLLHVPASATPIVFGIID